jgi:hypothetical protein
MDYKTSVVFNEIFELMQDLDVSPEEQLDFHLCMAMSIMKMDMIPGTYRECNEKGIILHLEKVFNHGT